MTLPVSSATPGQRFRARLAAGPIACIGAYDALSARLIESAGAQALYVSGFAAAASAFGLPDLGIVSQTEMAEHIRRICAATSLPVIADADTGYGGTLNVERTVRLWEHAGAAGLHLEDQGFPKRCGHISGKSVVSKDEFVLKLKAALYARRDPSFFLIARTDALAVSGLEDTIDRCLAYAATGADALFVDAPRSEEDLVRIAVALCSTRLPLVFNSARTGKSPVLTEYRLAEIGYPIVLYPLETMLASQKAVRSALGQILATGSTDTAAPLMATFAEVNALVDLAGHVSRDNGDVCT